jgi:peptidyl-prolyl cis-trans isomerase B (cyclophilin B)
MSRFATLAVTATLLALVIAACGEDEGDGSPSGGAFAQNCQKTGEKQWTAAPPQIIDTSKTYVATIKIEQGNIVVELFSDTPITTNNFVFLSCKGFYDGLTFHRVEPNFVIQGGDPTGTGRGGPGYTIPDEDDDAHLMVEAVISMAKSGPNTTGSQFFITIGLGASGSLSYLDPDFTVFGQVTQGMDVAKQIAVGDVIETVTIEER